MKKRAVEQKLADRIQHTVYRGAKNKIFSRVLSTVVLYSKLSAAALIREAVMQDFFDPETMLLSDELLQRYESALKKLSERALYIWLLYRKGLNATEIAVALMEQDEIKKYSRRRHDAYRKKVERILSETQKELKARCVGKKRSRKAV